MCFNRMLSGRLFGLGRLRLLSSVDMCTKRLLEDLPIFVFCHQTGSLRIDFSMQTALNVGRARLWIPAIMCISPRSRYAIASDALYSLVSNCSLGYYGDCCFIVRTKEVLINKPDYTKQLNLVCQLKSA